MDCTAFAAWFGTVGQWFAALGTLSAVLYLIYRDYWKRPKPTLSFDSNTDVKDQINTVGLPPSVVSRWVRVKVQNSPGRRAAKSCRVFLIGIEATYPNGEVEDVFPNDVRQLRWTHQPPEQLGRDLLPGVIHQVDLLAAVQGEDRFHIQVDPPYVQQRPGKYRFRMQVSAEDAHPQVLTIPIRWDGAWNTLRTGPAADSTNVPRAWRNSNMATLSSIPLEVLVAVYEGQRTESLQHRMSILNSYGFAMAGLIALGAGAMAPGRVSLPIKVLLTFAILLICASFCGFIKKQRSEAEKGLAILRDLERHWNVHVCDESGSSSLLPLEWSSPTRLQWGLTRCDLYQVGSSLLLGVLVLLVAWWLPLA
jgi:hypothetical protein